MTIRKNLNFRNQDRKFLTALLDRMFQRWTGAIFSTCYEKKTAMEWFLTPYSLSAEKCRGGNICACYARTKGNESVYSEFEQADAGEQMSASGRVVAEKERNVCIASQYTDYILSRMDREKRGANISFGIPRGLQYVDSAAIIVQIRRSAEKGRTYFQVYTAQSHEGLIVKHQRRVRDVKAGLRKMQVKEVGKMIRSKLTEKLRKSTWKGIY